jgi:membrane protein
VAEKASTREKTAPHPEDPRKPDSPDDVTKPGWKYVFRKTMREFTTDQCTDLAASLTYYATLALFPALLAIVSLLGLFGQAERTTNAVLDIMSTFVSPDMIEGLKEPITNLVETPAAGFAFVTGVVIALWSASGYVGAFARAMNRIYSVQEGRPFYKLRPTMFIITIISVILLVIAGLTLVLSGPIAEKVGAAIGLGEVALTVWNVLKWPVLAGIAVVLIAILYYGTPNVKQPKFRWMSLGSLIALIVWLIASLLFAFYVSNFSSYNATYGSLGTIIVFLLWVWITNIALLFGAEFDAEMERVRELQAGIEAEETIQLPPRDTKQSDKLADKVAQDVLIGRRLRQTNGKTDGKENANKEDSDKKDEKANR